MGICVIQHFLFVFVDFSFMSPPKKWGDIMFLALLSVCLSVCLFVSLSVRNAFVSTLYLLNSRRDLQITLHKCRE